MIKSGLVLFLEKIRTPSFFARSGVIVIRCHDDYPILFFSLLAQTNHRPQGHTTTLDLQEIDMQAAMSAVQTSFLGNHTVYWLKKLPEIPVKQRTVWANYLQDYRGPNLLICCVDQQTNITPTAGMVFDLPHTIGRDDFFVLYGLMACDITKAQRQFIEQVYGMHESLPLEAACLIIRYMSVVGSGGHEFITTWLSSIIVPEKSLFTLSQYLFARDSKKFFSYWTRIGKDYSEVFWISFWSEQLWRASLFIMLTKAGKPIEARKMAFRLPFSFIQKDYQFLSLADLYSAHDHLNSADFALKNGGGVLALDLFYTRFFHVSTPK